MNAVEIEEAITELANAEFDPTEFPYAFLEAFGNKATTIKRLKSGSNNKSDVKGGVLQYNNIHMAVCKQGKVKQTLDALRESPKTTTQRAKFVLATDGVDFEAEDLASGEVVACQYQDFPDHFGFFLPLAGISTVKQIRENTFDIRATSRLNKLYVALLQHNPDWSTEARRHDMNHFMARLIFCFFAEDTDIFGGDGSFTKTIEQMSTSDASNTHEVIAELFRAMNTKRKDHDSADIKRWARDFPYVNGGLFSGSVDVPRFSKIARSYLLHVGNLDWKQINPDIFGSMIQAVADEDERGELGMHYTSVPNILKVLNPLFLDDLRAHLEEAGDSKIKLLNLRKRLARIRVFDPACGSGNFLVIAYKEMRKIEYEINKRRGEPDQASDIPLTNFRGIELRDFSAEIARLALIIAEYQCDVLYRGKQLALAEFLPLDAQNWITCGNALRLDWLQICPPTGTDTAIRSQANDLFNTPLNQPEIVFENEGGETYICGNPPYLGSRNLADYHKADLATLFDHRVRNWKSLDYVAGWFIKAADYGLHTNSTTAFVATNSICQGLQVSILWPLIFKTGHKIIFAHTSFKWSNLASHNAGVTVVIVGISKHSRGKSRLFVMEENGTVLERKANDINAYLAPTFNVIVNPSRQPQDQMPEMLFGNMPRDGGHLCLSPDERRKIIEDEPKVDKYIQTYVGSKEMIQGHLRYCLWIEDSEIESSKKHSHIKVRLEKVAQNRSKSRASSTRSFASTPHRFVQIQGTAKKSTIAVAGVSSEKREYLPVALYDKNTIISNLLFGIYDAELWSLSLIASRLHLAWIASVCGKLETRYRYSNTLGWNTFPVPKLTTKNKEDLTQCAEDILLAREKHFPATIADLYDPENMPANLREAHERNDEVLERIYIGRRFKNDTERLEKLFELYTKMTASKTA